MNDDIRSEDIDAGPARDTTADDSDDAREFYIVGVGASAGGLEALERMFKNVSIDTGMAFVVVQHLSPDFKSVMDELLSRHTAMTIHRVEDGMPVEPNSVYLIPPKKEMIISDGRLLLTDRDPDQASHHPIDDFFRSLAHDAGSNAIAVILSGTGSDGSRGIRDIHEAGGLVITQTEASAKFDGMIKSAMETGIVDVSVPPERVGEILTRYINHPLRSQWGEDASGPVDESSLERIFRLLQQRHKIDFNYYKPTTIGRRIERRIQLNHNGGLEEYVRQLESEPQEVDRLYKDLLIGVTRFFRDQDAFAALERELPGRLLKMKPGDEFRGWVAACATGEEAYSIAILIHECLEDMNRDVDVKIFATDVHRASLDVAHRGVYPETALQDLPATRRERYFTKSEAGWQIKPEIRQMIVFAPHNLVKDAPFTKTDLITCRNLLIYLRPQAQKKVLSLFHFGLKTGGMLFLGSSESPGELSGEFETLDERAKLYSKRRDVRLPADVRTFLPDPTGMVRPSTPAAAPAPGTLQPVYDDLLAQFMPPGLLIDERREVVHTFGGAGRFLRMRDGRLTHNLLEMVDGDLKLALAGAFQRLAKGEEQVRFGRVSAKTTEGDENVEVAVSKVSDRGAVGYFLVTFAAVESPGTPVVEAGSMDLADATRDRVIDLEQELRYTKENLQATIEELETSNQELQATNEELVASNEELQSTNEELHSVNEELYTVNAEYQKKISELTELTNDMENLLVSTEVHTLFLDAGDCIRKFTPKMAEVFNLIPGDIGRRIEGFTQNIRCADLSQKLAHVLETGERHEEQTQDAQGNDFLLRILPYRSGTKISGTVLTLIDISALKRAEERFAHLSAIVETSDDAILSKDLDGTILSWNAGAVNLYGYSEEEAVGRNVRLIVPDDKRDELEEIFRRIRRAESIRTLETRRIAKDGTILDVSLSISPMFDKSGNLAGAAAIGRNTTRRKTAERKLEEEIRRRDDFLAMLSHELRNPLGAVLGATRILIEQNDAEAGDGPHPLQVIQRQAEHMATLLNDLLDVSRISKGRIKLQKSVVDLTALTSPAVETVRPLLERNEQRCELSVPDSPVWVDVDSERIQQILINLLTNASRYSPSGEIITLAIDPQDGIASISVKDNGIGIHPESIEDIFDMFVQGDQSIDRSDGGMGVGLALVKQLIELHGGNVYAKSPGPGQGSEFVVELPISPPPRSQQLEQTSDAGRLHARRVLLIEDNTDAREMMVTILEMRGFEVIDAADGRSGLKLAKDSRPDVAIVDIGLPELDGYEVARRIRADRDTKGIRLIALTGYGQEEDKRNALDAGFDHHLTKPLSPDKLIEILTESTEQRSDLVSR